MSIGNKITVREYFGMYDIKFNVDTRVLTYADDTMVVICAKTQKRKTL